MKNLKIALIIAITTITTFISSVTAEEIKVTAKINADGNIGVVNLNGEGDARGDLLVYEFTARFNNGAVVSIGGELSSPAVANGSNTVAGATRDTANLTLTLGQENNQWGLYGTIGVLNGATLKANRSIKNAGHAVLGLGTARESAASSNQRLLAAFGGRFDKSVAFGDDFYTTVTGAGYVGTDRTHGTAAVTLSWENPIKTDISGLPAQDAQTGVYLGLSVDAIMSDVRLEHLQGWNKIQPKAFAGFGVKITPKTTLTTEISSTSSVVNGQNNFELSVKLSSKW